MSCEDCYKINIPERLCEDGKPAPLAFDIDSELLYRRHKQEGNTNDLRKLSENVIGGSIFKLDNDSYNRSAISTSSDVLLNDEPTKEKGNDFYKNWGVISIPVKSINAFSEQIVINDKTQEATMQVVHTSKKCNYSHSEIFCYLDGVKTNGQPPKVSRIFFRKRLKEMVSSEIEYKKIAS